MKNRILDANEIFSGAEPKYDREMNKLELIKTLNWYSQNRLSKDAYKYAELFFNKTHKTNINDSSLKSRPITFGFICRILLNGGILPQTELLRFREIETQILQECKNQKKKQPKEKPVIVQDRTLDKISELIGEFEIALDELMMNEFKPTVSPISVLQNKAKPTYIKPVIDHFKNKRQEFSDVLNTNDNFVKEAWSNFKKTDLKKTIAFIDQIIVDCNNFIGATVKTRKPRKRKVKTPDQIIKNLLYCDNFDELKLKSINPKELLGASQLWVYNTKYKKIGVYHAKDIEGFTVKGSTILNFDESKSVQKTVRKPEDFLPQILKGGKVFLRTALTNLKTIETNLTGRINKEVILLRVLK